MNRILKGLKSAARQGKRVLDRPRPRPPGAVRLRFTGGCDLAEFQARCSEHEFWYHSFYFDNGFVQRGDYDIGRDIADYGFPTDMAGMSVLDVGTGSGWFATYFEQRGADVTTTDVRGYCDFDVFGRDVNPPLESEKTAPDRIMPDGREVYYSPVSKGFWVMKDLLGLNAEYVNARVYDLCPALFGGRKFDLVFVGSVLMHLRDPIGALMAIHSVCGHQLIATSLILREFPWSGGNPRMQLQKGAGDGISWWTPNRECLAEWAKAAGFQDVDVSRSVFITSDTPYADEGGRSSGVTQSQALLSAFTQ